MPTLCADSCGGYWWKFVKKWWYIVAIFFGTLLAIIIIAAAAPRTTTDGCPCTGFDDYCCVRDDTFCNGCRCKETGAIGTDDYHCQALEESTELTGGTAVVQIVFLFVFFASLLWICCVFYVHHSEVSWDECCAGCSCCPPPKSDQKGPSGQSNEAVRGDTISERDDEERGEQSRSSSEDEKVSGGFWSGWTQSDKQEKGPPENEATNEVTATNSPTNYMVCGDSCVVS